MNLRLVIVAALVVFVTEGRRHHSGKGSKGKRPERPPWDDGGSQDQRCADGKLLTQDRLEEVTKALGTLVQTDGRIPLAVRLIFHDCVGGCDGCVDPNNPSNAGPMLDLLPLLDDFYRKEQLSKEMSKADLYALTGIVAVQEGIKNANVGCRGYTCLPMPNFRFKYCREDAPVCPTPARRAFPSGHLDHVGVMDFFRKEFGLSPLYATALLGAHTLGGASGASGWRGFWKENATEASKFDQRYYTLMSDPDIRWQHIDKASDPNTAVSPPEERWQWEGFRDGEQVSFMLNADVALLLNIQPNAKGQSSCDFNTCGPAPTASLVKRYADRPDWWLEDFKTAFDVMITKGASPWSLRDPAGSSSGSGGRGGKHHHH